MTVSHGKPPPGDDRQVATSPASDLGGPDNNGAYDPLENQGDVAETGGADSRVETGLILPVPEMESFIRTWRGRLSAVPPEGVPAHISLLYPYLEPAVCSWSIGDVTDFFASIEPFDFSLTEVGWFDRRVVFLRPDPSEVFLEITNLLTARWSQCVPYGGKHKEIVPHLTLGIEGTDEEMDLLAAEAEKLLPVRCRATQAWLMEGVSYPAQWRVSQRFVLGSAGTNQ